MDILRRTTKAGMWARVLAARFAVASHGNVAMIFAIVMPVLVLLTVGGVDIHRASTVRANLQDALDAATLAAARSEFIEEEDLTRVGMASLRANLKAYPQIALREDLSSFTLTGRGAIIARAVVDVDALVANIVLPPYGRVLDDTLPVAAQTEVMRSQDRIEIALVLDNTGSMAGNRIHQLRIASEKFLDVVFAGATDPGDVKVSIVPYVAAVNIKAGTGFSMNWMDHRGSPDQPLLTNANASRHHGENVTYRDDGITYRVNHWALFDAMNVDWKGCVEARPDGLDVQDVAPTLANRNSLFVPYLWPDEPSRPSGGPSNWNAANSYIADDNPDDDDALDPMYGSPPRPRGTNDSVWARIQGDWSKYARLTQSGVEGRALLDDRGRSTSRVDMSASGTDGTGLFEGGEQLTFGPNKSCGQPVTPLTSDKGLLVDDVQRMVPWRGGGTNTAQGLFWGWAMLSPGEPFTQGRPYRQEHLRKIAVIMTDGENLIYGGDGRDQGNNQAWFNRSDYSAYGFLGRNRLGTTTADTAKGRINERMLIICEAMKHPDRSIEIYTIIVGVQNAAQKESFRACASNSRSGGKNYFEINDANEMPRVFETIATEIGSLRITR